MKLSSALFASVALLAGAALCPAHAAPAAAPALPTGTLRTMRANAEAAGDNAAIYQWRRVNLEVDRIVAAEHSLEQALPKGAAPAPADALREAVLDLRAARLAHDSDRTQAAARQVAAQSELLLR